MCARTVDCRQQALFTVLRYNVLVVFVLTPRIPLLVHDSTINSQEPGNTANYDEGLILYLNPEVVRPESLTRYVDQDMHPLWPYQRHVANHYRFILCKYAVVEYA